MRTNLNPDSPDLFQRRLEEKEAMREEVFSIRNKDSVAAKEYVHRQVVVNPKRISVGKPAFAAKF